MCHDEPINSWVTTEKRFQKVSGAAHILHRSTEKATLSGSNPDLPLQCINLKSQHSFCESVNLYVNSSQHLAPLTGGPIVQHFTTVTRFSYNKQLECSIIFCNFFFPFWNKNKTVLFTFVQIPFTIDDHLSGKATNTKKHVRSHGWAQITGLH